MRYATILVALSLQVFLGGCAPRSRKLHMAAPSTPGSPSVAPVTDATVRIGSTSRDLPDQWSLARDGQAGVRLAEGETAWDAGDVHTAQERFEQAIALDPSSGAADAARWYLGHIYTYITPNRALAAKRYLEIVAAHPTGYESRKAHLAAAAALAEGQQWDEARALLTDILARPDLTFEQQVESLARRGYVLLAQGALDAADEDFSSAISAWQCAPKVDDPYFVAMAHYYRGDVRRARFQQAPLRRPLEELKIDLDAKRRMLIAAYDAYKEALAFGMPYWGTAAGYAMAELFFEYYQIATSSAPPQELTADLQLQYREEVAAIVFENLGKARDGHRKNVELAKAYGVSTDWSRASELRAAELDLAIAAHRRPGTP